MNIFTAENFWKNVNIKGSDECWLWGGYIDPSNGQGKFFCNSRSISSRKAAWEFTYGKIENNKRVHNICKSHLCLNPSHLSLNRPQISPETLFWEKIQKQDDGHWIWMGTLNTGGYGMTWAGDQHMLSHRFSWILVNGPIPEGKFVLHNCDIPRCNQPEHLRLGNNIDNSKDRCERKRQWSKLSESQVVEIRSNPDNLSRRELAKKYNIAYGTMHDILYHKTWKHLKV